MFCSAVAFILDWNARLYIRGSAFTGGKGRAFKARLHASAVQNEIK